MPSMFLRSLPPEVVEERRTTSLWSPGAGSGYGARRDSGGYGDGYGSRYGGGS
jgi:hypothetical protein